MTLTFLSRVILGDMETQDNELLIGNFYYSSSESSMNLFN